MLLTIQCSHIIRNLPSLSYAFFVIPMFHLFLNDLKFNDDFVNFLSSSNLIKALIVSSRYQTSVFQAQGCANGVTCTFRQLKFSCLV